jgi:subtilisin family serine protease
MLKRLLSAVAGFAIAATFAPAATAGTIPGEFIVVLKEGVDGSAVATEHARALGAEISVRYQHALNGYAARLSPGAVTALRHDNRVRFVSENREVSAASRCMGVDLAAVQCLPEGVDRIDAELSSSLAGNGSGSVNVNVAVLDTGIDGTHPDLNVVGGVNCTGDKYGATTDSSKQPHGTHVAGTIGALDNGFGVVGTAPGARLWSVRVLNKQGFGSTAMVVCGIDFVTATRTDSDPSNDIAVANMSLGGSGSDDGNCGNTNNDAMHVAICNSVAAGATYVVAAGNESSDFQYFTPASYDEVLTTTAVVDFDGIPGGAGVPPPSFPKFSCGQEDDDTSAFFSNFATTALDQAHAIAAPGACIFSTWSWAEDQYRLLSGTSMASPHAAGTVALCIASRKCKGTPRKIIEKIVGDAAVYNTANPSYGFEGDPLRPDGTGMYFGYLVRAGNY